MGMNSFAPFLKINGCFIVQNISPQVKTIKIFNYPINYGGTRDLLQIPGVAEGDIRASLLKGELQHKLRAKDIIVICSDIDLLQFNAGQKMFLQAAGIVNGLDVGSTGGGITAQDHQILRQLIHFIDEGPGDGFASGAFKEIIGQPFPSSTTWYADISKNKKIVEKLINRNESENPTLITWRMYDTDGATIVHTIIDNISYINNVFESTRIRTIT